MHRMMLVLAGLTGILFFAGATLMGGSQPLPDLVVTDFQLSPAFPKPSQEARLTATIVNQGALIAANETFAVEFFAGRRKLATRFISGLASGESMTLDATWDAEPGEFRLRVVSDAFRKISELDENNNTIVRVINVSELEPTQSDLIVKSLELQPASARPGELAKITALVANRGSGPAPVFDLAFEADGNIIGTQRLEGLAAGQEIAVSLDWTVELGERVLRVKADPDARIIETDEANNALAKTTDFGPPPGSCAQQVFLEFEDKALEQLEEATGLSHEALLTLFIPMMKRSLEKDFDGVNVRFFYNRPAGAYTTIYFDSENRQSILGLAPLDRGNFNKRDTAFVFIGSFVARGGLANTAVPSVAVIIGKVASHELGHALGLNHNAQGGIMNAEAELNPFSVEFETFRPEDLEYLKRILPMNC